jgi:hypothetical protein
VIVQAEAHDIVGEVGMCRHGPGQRGKKLEGIKDGGLVRSEGGRGVNRSQVYKEVLQLPGPAWREPGSKHPFYTGACYKTDIGLRLTKSACTGPKRNRGRGEALIALTLTLPETLM